MELYILLIPEKGQYMISAQALNTIRVLGGRDVDIEIISNIPIWYPLKDTGVISDIRPI